MILSGAPISSIPLGAIPGADFLVAIPEVGASVDLNGRLAKDLGLRIEKVPAWLTATSRSWPNAKIPGRAGWTKSASDPVEAAVELRLVGTIRGASIADMRAKADTIKAVLSAGPVRVITPDQVTRFVTAELVVVDVQDFGPSFRQIEQPCEISLTANDPLRYDLCITQAQAPAATRARLPLGTAIVRPVITITGAATNPVITLRDYLGNVIATMTFGATALLAGETLVVDCAAFSVSKNGVSSLASLTVGDFLKLDPLAIADRDKAKWPTLETSSGTITVRYARAWR